MKILINILIVFLLTNDCYGRIEVFEGKIGKYPIIICFPVNDIGEYTDNGGYFYKSKKQSILFTESEGNKDKLVLRLYEDESFELERNSKGGYDGFWSISNSKEKLPVKLFPYDYKRVKNNFIDVSSVDDFSPSLLWYIASSNLRFREDSVTLAGDVVLRWYSDSIYKIPYFRIGSENVQKINETLFNNHLSLVENRFYGCGCDGHDDLENFAFVNSGRGIFSYSFSLGICYCFRAAHPFLFEEVYNLDLEKDEILDFDKVFQFSDKGFSYFENNETEYNKYKENIVAPKIVEFLRSSFPELIESPKGDKNDLECYYLDSHLWQSIYNWMLKSDAVNIPTYEPARGYGSCAIKFEIPAKYFLPYLTPEYRERVFIDS